MRWHAGSSNNMRYMPVHIYIIYVVFVWRVPHARVIKCRRAFLSNVAVVVIIVVYVVSRVLVTTLYMERICWDISMCGPSRFSQINSANTLK